MLILEYPPASTNTTKYTLTIGFIASSSDVFPVGYRTLRHVNSFWSFKIVVKIYIHYLIRIQGKERTWKETWCPQIPVQVLAYIYVHFYFGILTSHSRLA